MDGMFTTLLQPHLLKIYPMCGLEEVRHNTQKEKRIIDTLEPVMNQHRLVVNKSVIREDNDSIRIYPAEKQLQYSLFYQMTRLTKDRNCLGHDDRLDCLAIAVNDCLSLMMVDADAEIRKRQEEEFEREIEYIYGSDYSDTPSLSWW